MSLHAALDKVREAATETLDEIAAEAKDNRAAWHEVNRRLGAFEAQWISFRGEMRETTEKVLNELARLNAKLSMNGSGDRHG